MELVWTDWLGPDQNSITNPYVEEEHMRRRQARAIDSIRRGLLAWMATADAPRLATRTRAAQALVARTFQTNEL